jgi:predicted house-cleaning noncanonical NTP pyrophosphatase (MazG superfamily)
MINRLIKEQGYSAKDLILHYESILSDLLPERTHRIYLDNPDCMLNGIAIHKKELDSLTNTSIAELVQNYIAKQNEWNKNAETKMSIEDKLFREKTQNVISELEKWEPEHASSKHLKSKLLEKIQKEVKEYFEEVYGISDLYTELEAEQKFVERRINLEWYIKQLETQYPIVVESKKQLKQYHNELINDLGKLN